MSNNHDLNFHIRCNENQELKNSLVSVWLIWKRVIYIVGVTNFIVFFGFAMYIGGDALSGKMEGGHFYVASHGK